MGRVQPTLRPSCPDKVRQAVRQPGDTEPLGTAQDDPPPMECGGGGRSQRWQSRETKGGGMWLRLRTTGAAESRKLRTAGVTANIPHVRPAHRRTKPEEETDNESDNRRPHTNWKKKSDEIPDKGAEFNASRNLLWIFFYLSHGRNRKQFCRSSETTAQLGFGCALRLNNS